MDRKNLLKLIASAGYDIGFGAKKHFASFDIIEKTPGWLGFASLIGGIYSLFEPFWTQPHATAAFVVFGVVSLYVGMYSSEKAKYDEVGRLMTRAFHDLHTLYRKVDSLSDGVDLVAHENELKSIRECVIDKSISKQLFLSDWYAHYKFFWQMQTDWIDEELELNFFSDKVPLSAYGTIFLMAVIGATRFCV